MRSPPAPQILPTEKPIPKIHTFLIPSQENPSTSGTLLQKIVLALDRKTPYLSIHFQHKQQSHILALSLRLESDSSTASPKDFFKLSNQILSQYTDATHFCWVGESLNGTLLRMLNKTAALDDQKKVVVTAIDGPQRNIYSSPSIQSCLARCFSIASVMNFITGSVSQNECDFFLMSEIGVNKPKANKLYLAIENDQIKYRTSLMPGSDSAELGGDISQKNGELYVAIQANNLPGLSESCKSRILDITSKRGHAPENNDIINPISSELTQTLTQCLQASIEYSTEHKKYSVKPGVPGKAVIYNTLSDAAAVLENEYLHNEKNSAEDQKNKQWELNQVTLNYLPKMHCAHLTPIEILTRHQEAGVTVLLCLPGELLQLASMLNILFSRYFRTTRNKAATHPLLLEKIKICILYPFLTEKHYRDITLSDYPDHPIRCDILYTKDYTQFHSLSSLNFSFDDTQLLELITERHRTNNPSHKKFHKKTSTTDCCFSHFFSRQHTTSSVTPGKKSAPQSNHRSV